MGRIGSSTPLARAWVPNTTSSSAGARPSHNPRCQPGLAHWEGALNNFAAGGIQTYISTFEVDGDTVTLSLDPERIGSPREFDWMGATRSRGAQPIPEDDTALASFRR